MIATPPYSTIEFMPGDESHDPFASPGGSVCGLIGGHFVGGTGTVYTATPTATNAPVPAAQSGADMRCAARVGDIRMGRATNHVAGAGERYIGRIAMTESSARLSGVLRTDNVGAVGGHLLVGEAHGRTDRMERTEGHVAVGAGRGRADGLSSVDGRAAIAMTPDDRSSDVKPASGTVRTGLALESSSDTGLARRDVRVDGATLFTGFGGLNESGVLLGLSDEELIRFLEDSFVADGFYAGRARLADDAAYAVPQAEVDEFIRLVREGATIRELLNRPFSQSFRMPTEEGTGTVSVVLSFVAPGPVWHGQSLVLAIEARNDGGSDAYDMLLAIRLPRNASFERFPVQASRESGAVQYADAASGLIVLRLYRPLLSGQTFKATALVRLAPWLVRTRYVPRRSLPFASCR